MISRFKTFVICYCYLLFGTFSKAIEWVNSGCNSASWAFTCPENIRATSQHQADINKNGGSDLNGNEFVPTKATFKKLESVQDYLWWSAQLLVDEEAFHSSTLRCSEYIGDKNVHQNSILSLIRQIKSPDHPRVAQSHRGPHLLLACHCRRNFSWKSLKW